MSTHIHRSIDSSTDHSPHPHTVFAATPDIGRLAAILLVVGGLGSSWVALGFLQTPEQGREHGAWRLAVGGKLKNLIRSKRSDDLIRSGVNARPLARIAAKSNNLILWSTSDCPPPSGLDMSITGDVLSDFDFSGPIKFWRFGAKRVILA